MSPYCEVLGARAEQLLAHKFDVEGAWIMALGQSDIDWPESELHRRTQLGVQRLAPFYWTVETGKYTTAPLYATQAAQAAIQAFNAS